MRITLIVGLPGSGKTYLANKLALERTTVIDDITSCEQLPESPKELIITDVNFCDAKILETAKYRLKDMYPNAEFDIIYFENDAKKARLNVLYRNDGRNVEGTISRFERIYSPPTDGLFPPREIWQSK